MSKLDFFRKYLGNTCSEKHGEPGTEETKEQKNKRTKKLKKQKEQKKRRVCPFIPSGGDKTDSLERVR